ncbi:MAG: hypothetical protein FWD36_07895 [Treponema sp.]|nr:hypothetical protein [Treponema sp.]
MKRLFKLFGIIALSAVIVFSMAGCGEDDGDDTIATSGRLTITGIPSEYNGSYAYGGGTIGIGPMARTLYAAASVNNSGSAGTAGIISNGTVALNVWEATNSGPVYLKSFDGSGSAEFTIYVVNSAALNEATMNDNDNYLWEDDVSVIFIGGIAAHTFN